MFRYNSRGEFNVPYGGISYNSKTLDNKILYLKSPEMKEKLGKTTIRNQDFEDFLNDMDLKKEDFIFLDPPYDSEFSSYCGNAFEKEDHIRLANYLKKTEAKFMLIIKETEFISGLYSDFNIQKFDKNYSVNFMNRNAQKTKHLLITNY